MKTLGICLGATTISAVVLTSKKEKIKIHKRINKPHEGNIQDIFIDILKKNHAEKIDRIVVTGRKFKQNVNLTTITESLAVENALEKEDLDKKNYNILISAGGETTIAYELNKTNYISNVHIGNKCASGTGEFFLQQIRRMDLDSKKALEIGKDSHIHPISGRCSVFCKSDCTHALNRGESKGNVVAGLCKMMSDKMDELISGIESRNVILIGGVTKNNLVVDNLKKEVDHLFIPENSNHFEAFGAALFALENETLPLNDLKDVYSYGKSSFELLEPLKKYDDKVNFQKISYKKPKNNQVCILGIDVGSTTTKAVLMNKEDDSIISKVYLRTNGNPINSAQKCYKKIQKEIKNKKIKIVGLAVTGSGRKIVGLHAFSDSIINEIITHAAASVYFDPEVNTIFEIGGQDAKYTYLINGVPVDYAMNEACSAGTGSFLEESAYESLNVKMEDIAEIALEAENPPNFNDQCAAFIGSDIKIASQEGISKKDIIGGLVYSICMNYKNRVMGNRKIGNKIFMQGGVCYNKAVPIAMAVLTGKKIIVPPEPGLMGAFGAALELKKRQENGIEKEKKYNLEDLINRKVEYGKSFVCIGGIEKCDRKCEIIQIKLGQKSFPFGGACNKYYNQIHKLDINSNDFDNVNYRENLVFRNFEKKITNESKKIKIGINQSFFTHTYFPFYNEFFEKLDMEVILPEKSNPKGEEQTQSSFCYPMILAHGYFKTLLKKKPDYIFMPHILQLDTKGDRKEKTGNRKSCVFVQGEPYTLKQTFKKELGNTEILSPILDFSLGMETERKKIVKYIKEKFSISGKKIKKAFDSALEKQQDFFEKTKKKGREVLKSLEENEDEICIVVFGRPYNSFTETANMGIPRKFASKGIKVIPYEFLAFEDETFDFFMHWGIGEMILKAAQIVKKHPQLFGTYITNFSCGPDSFLVEFFRYEMKSKPSLTLEIDSHTADAGINTRIEAFLDVVNHYRKLQKHRFKEKIRSSNKKFQPAKLVGKGFNSKIILSDGRIVSGKSSDFTFLFPNMSHYIMDPVISYLQSKGLDAKMVPATTPESLKMGRSQTSNKECLPQTILMGNILAYLKNEHENGRPVMYFHGTDTSPCRLEQYFNNFKLLIEKNEIENFVVVRVDDRDGWSGFGMKYLIRAFQALIIGEVIEDISCAMKVIAKDSQKAIEIVDTEFEKIKKNFAGNDSISLRERLIKIADIISEIPRNKKLEEIPIVSIIGEIYVRNSPFARRRIENILAEKGIIAKIAPFAEVMSYADHCLINDLTEVNINPYEKLKVKIQNRIKSKLEKDIKNIFATTGFYRKELIDADKMMNSSKNLVSPHLRGEVPITVGSFYKSIIDESHGVISIGPFACLPSRLAESLIKPNKGIENKIIATGKNDKIRKLQAKGVDTLPFLSIETDGNSFTQVVESELEVFVQHVKRFYLALKE